MHCPKIACHLGVVEIYNIFNTNMFVKNLIAHKVWCCLELLYGNNRTFFQPWNNLLLCIIDSSYSIKLSSEMVFVYNYFVGLCWCVGVEIWCVIVLVGRCQHLFEVLKRTTSLSYFQILDGNYAIPAFLISFHLGGKKLNNSRIYRPSLYLSLHYDYKILWFYTHD